MRARKAGLDLNTLFQLILEGPLGNPIFTIKSKKFIEEDFSPQASLSTVREMVKHIVDTAHDIKVSIPNILNNLHLTTAAINQGLGHEDAIAIIKVLDN